MKRRHPHRPADPLLYGPLRGHWRTYLVPALGGAAVTSVYSIVDTIAIGYGVGPTGTAAAAVLIPSFGLMAFLGTLLGMGGAILLATARGRGDRREGDAWFTLTFLLCAAVGVAVAAAVLLAGDAFWRFCGADDALTPLANEYGFWVVLTWPGAMLSLALACLIRNDGAPGYALAAIVAGGVLNILGDWLLVFPFRIGTGMAGAGIATAAGCALQTLLLVGYLFRRRSTLRFAPPSLWPRRAIRRLCAVGLAPALPNAAVAVVVTLANHQAMRHGGVAALSILGIMLTLTTLYQQLFNGVAQALQPIVSVNFGAGGRARIRRAFWMGVRVSFMLGLACSLLSLFFPIGTLRLFMNPTPEVIADPGARHRGLVPADGALHPGVRLPAGPPAHPARGDAGPAAQRWVQRGVPDRPSAAPGARRGVAGPHRDGVADVAPGPAAASPTLGTRNPTLTLQTMKGPRFPPGALLL